MHNPDRILRAFRSHPEHGDKLFASTTFLFLPKRHKAPSARFLSVKYYVWRKQFSKYYASGCEWSMRRMGRIEKSSSLASKPRREDYPQSINFSWVMVSALRRSICSLRPLKHTESASVTCMSPRRRSRPLVRSVLVGCGRRAFYLHEAVCYQCHLCRIHSFRCSQALELLLCHVDILFITCTKTLSSIPLEC